MRFFRLVAAGLKKALMSVLIALDYLLMALTSAVRATTRDDANADYGTDGMQNGYRMGPDRIARPGERREDQ